MKNNVKSIVYFKKIDSDKKNLINKFTMDGIDKILAKSLVLRDIKDVNIAKFNYDLLPYTDLKDISKMVNYLSDIIINRKNELVYIVADYDCDGATSCSLLYLYMKKIGVNIKYIVPNRFTNGYGLSESIIKEFESEKPQWIITVDNGTASFAGVDYANNLNIKVLITDHHLPAKDKGLPNALAIVNPNQQGDKSKLNNLSGCGVVFYILMALNDHLKEIGYYKDKEIIDVFEWIDIVSLSTIADVVFLDDNNRLLVKMGLDKIKNNKNVNNGIQSLIKISDKENAFVNSQDFGFAIGPKINAAGRLEDMTVGIKCLISNDINNSFELSKELHELNRERKKIQEEMSEISNDILNKYDGDSYTKVIYESNFHEGVVGIVAGKVKEMYNRPTIVFSKAQEEGYLKGSGRSIDKLHLRDAIDLVYKEHPDMFKGFGGHAMAAGVTIKEEFLEIFSEKFEKVVANLLKTININKVYYVDGELNAVDMNKDTASSVLNYIWGQGFFEPLWYGKFTILESKILAGKHLKLILMKDGYIFEAIEFFNENIPSNKEIEIVYKLSINNYNGERLQLIIENSNIELIK